MNRPYDKNKTYGLIVDYCGITKELQKALAIFDQADVEGALESIDKELKELKIRHTEAMSFFKDVDRNDDSAIIVKFEPVNVRDEFEYVYKMFSKSLDIVLPRKEAGPYIDDFKYASKIRNMLRTSYEGPGISLRTEGKKVQQLIDDHVRAIDIAKLMERTEITYENFLGYVAKFKTERARTALIKNKARQIISELSYNNPVYYQKLRERLEKLIEEEEKRRKENANYFNKFREIYHEAYLYSVVYVRTIGLLNKWLRPKFKNIIVKYISPIAYDLLSVIKNKSHKPQSNTDLIFRSYTSV